MKTQDLNFKSKHQKVDQKTFINYHTDGLNSYQNYLYKRALFGIKSLPQDEVQRMCSAKKRRVNNVYIRAQKTLNEYKHKVTKAITDSFLKSMFPNSIVANSLASITEIDNTELNRLSLKDLGISKQEIIDLFIKEGILPNNFHELTPQDNPKFLPSLKK